MQSLGFSELPPRFSLGYTDSLAFACRNAAVFDLRPANVVLTPEGLAVPIDAIACPLDAEARSILGLDD